MALEINGEFIKFDEYDINFRYQGLVSESYNNEEDENIRIEKWIYKPLNKKFKRTIKTKTYGKCSERKQNIIKERKQFKKFGDAMNETQNKSITNLADEIFMEFNPKVFNSYAGKKYLNNYVDKFNKNPYNCIRDKIVFYDDALLLDKNNIDELDKVNNINKMMDLFKAFTEDENNGFQSNNNDNQNMNNHNQNMNNHGQNNTREDKSNIWVIKKNRTEDQNELISKMNKIQNMHSNNNDSKDNAFVPIHLRKHKPKSRLNNCNNINQSQLQSQTQFPNFYENTDNSNLESNNFQSNNFQSNNLLSNNNLQKSFNMYSSNKKQMTPREQRLEKYKKMELRKNNNFIDINSKTNNNGSGNLNDFKKTYEEKYSLKLIGFSSLEDMKPIDIVHMVKEKNINSYIKCCIPRNRTTGKNKNLCFLDFDTYEEASYAFDVLNENKIRMDYAIITPEWVK